MRRSAAALSDRTPRAAAAVGVSGKSLTVRCTDTGVRGGLTANEASTTGMSSATCFASQPTVMRGTTPASRTTPASQTAAAFQTAPAPWTAPASRTAAASRMAPVALGAWCHQRYWPPQSGCLGQPWLPVAVAAAASAAASAAAAAAAAGVAELPGSGPLVHLHGLPLSAPPPRVPTARLCLRSASRRVRVAGWATRTP
eukprot:356995-Chlamydomonas_euryale.AAC.7